MSVSRAARPVLERGPGMVRLGDQQRRLTDRREQHVDDHVDLIGGNAAVARRCADVRAQAAERVALVDLPPARPADDSRWVDQRDPLHDRIERRRSHAPQPARRLSTGSPAARPGRRALAMLATSASSTASKRLPCSGSGGTARREPSRRAAGWRRSTCPRSRAHRTARARQHDRGARRPALLQPAVHGMEVPQRLSNRLTVCYVSTVSRFVAHVGGSP